MEIERLASPDKTVIGLNRYDGESISPNAMIDKIEELLGE